MSNIDFIELYKKSIITEGGFKAPDDYVLKSNLSISDIYINNDLMEFLLEITKYSQYIIEIKGCKIDINPTYDNDNLFRTVLFRNINLVDCTLYVKNIAELKFLDYCELKETNIIFDQFISVVMFKNQTTLNGVYINQQPVGGVMIKEVKHRIYISIDTVRSETYISDFWDLVINTADTQEDNGQVFIKNTTTCRHIGGARIHLEDIDFLSVIDASRPEEEISPSRYDSVLGGVPMKELKNKYLKKDALSYYILKYIEQNKEYVKNYIEESNILRYTKED